MPWAEIGPGENQRPVGTGPTGYTGDGWHRGHKIANWGQRFAATLIDVVIATVAAHIVALIFGSWLVFFLFIWGCLDVMGVDDKGTSPGKKALGLTIIVPRLDPHTMIPMAYYPTKATLFWRFVAHFVDCVPMYLGFVRPAWHLARQTWADSIVGTLVMSNWPHETMMLTEDVGGVKDIL
jgi:uncharacterized RDD family membrane protein YckC